MERNAADEFAFRLAQAVEGHPMAPPTPHGRQRWLKERLEKETGVIVSANSVHKWMNGMSRPRTDNIREIARVLSVDEVWLSLGRRPVADSATIQEQASMADGATLLVAGLIEMNGGKTSFPGEDEKDVSLWANIAGQRVGLIIVNGQVKGSSITYMVPEPVGKNRIVAASVSRDGCKVTQCVQVLDLTNAERKNFGGFSVIQGTTSADGTVTIDGQHRKHGHVEDLSELAS